MAAFLNVDIFKIIKIFNIQQLYNNCGVKWFLCHYMASVCLSQYINKELFSSNQQHWEFAILSSHKVQEGRQRYFIPG